MGFRIAWRVFVLCDSVASNPVTLFWVEGRQRRPPLSVEGCGFSAVFLFYNWSPACVAIGAGIAFGFTIVWGLV